MENASNAEDHEELRAELAGLAAKNARYTLKIKRLEKKIVRHIKKCFVGDYPEYAQTEKAELSALVLEKLNDMIETAEDEEEQEVFDLGVLEILVMDKVAEALRIKGEVKEKSDGVEKESRGEEIVEGDGAVREKEGRVGSGGTTRQNLERD